MDILAEGSSGQPSGSQGAAGVAPVTDCAGAPVWSPPCFPDLNIVEEKYLRLLRIERKGCVRGFVYSTLSLSLLFPRLCFCSPGIHFETVRIGFKSPFREVVVFVNGAATTIELHLGIEMQ